ncbi:GntR family transcriptional regulator [Cohnella nanjingensis]|uniref:GntR family transcriptional regulator n=1 Tax=Cohnella nanjingensis TaxID=1387779 RepID=A0A7X0RVX3_9BACL|nr:GntR family transcriptional regulator [Cohnella nanjingensis]MBB6674652.1 GntR family transcriptional regulator [Cohnella nanjingensis]
MLDKNDFAPLYIQLHRILRGKILSGEYKQGEAIPSESEMMKIFQTTRGTIRNAISLLVSEGLVEQIRGKGTFVRLNLLNYSILNFGGFTDYLKSRNEVAVSQILEQKTVNLDGKDYFKLVRARGVKKEEAVLYLTIDTSYLPVSLFSGLDSHNFEEESLYHVLRNSYRVYPSRTEISLSPILIHDKVREILQVDKKESALLKAEGVVFDQNGVEIEKVSVIYGSNVEFKIMTNMNQA